MSTINKKLLSFMYSGSVLTLASAAFKPNINTIYGFNSAGTGYLSFKPTSNFNSLTQLQQDGSYILDAATVGFDLPGAVLVPSSGTVAVSKLRIPLGIGYQPEGDSITAAPVALGGSSMGYAKLLGDMIGGTFVHHGLSGKEIGSSIADIYLNSRLDVNRTYLSSIAHGMNDHRNEKSEENHAYFLRMVRLYLEMCFSQQYILANDAAISYGAGWVVSDLSGGKGRSGANAKSTGSSELATITLPACDNCTVALFGFPQGFASDSVEILLDGLTYTIVNLRGLSFGQEGSTVPVFLSFPYGQHKVSVRNIGGNNMWLDYVSIRRPASSTANVPALVYAATNATENQRNGVSQSIWDSMNARTHQVVQEYQDMGYPVRYVDLNVGYDPTPPASDEGVHPTAATHKNILLPNVLKVVEVS